MKIGIIQQANSSDREDNMGRLLQKIGQLAAEGVSWLYCKSCTMVYISVKLKIPSVFEQAEPIPGPSTHLFGQLAKEVGVVIVLSLFEKRAP